MTKHNILWPERRGATDAQIRTWYGDAVANGELDSLPGSPTAADMATALHQAGIITLGETRREPAVGALGPVEREAAGQLAVELVRAFGWAVTPQGHDYWDEVSRNLTNLAKGDGK